MLLELSRVTKFFGNRCIFKDVTLSVSRGTLTLMAGPNGAGKSTLLRLMAGLAKPSAGEVHCHVEEQQIGYLGHATFLYPALTATENLRFWNDLYGLSHDAKAIQAVLERVELAPFAMEKAGVFSRGMAQRLNLARVLLLKPVLWLLDEPGTGLDVRSAALLRREVSMARDAGAGIVWISHDIVSDGAGADRVLALEKGRLAYDGPVDSYTGGSIC